MNLEKLLEELDAVLEARVTGQRRKVFEVAHRLDPRLTFDDIMNPDAPELRGSSQFQYEDGTLAGLLSAQIVLRAHLRGLQETAPAGDHHHDDGTTRYRHCPRCGARLELRRHMAHDPPRLTCSGCAFVFYLDPKVAAGVILEQEGRILLARRDIEPRAGAWGFPSGYVDRGERVEEAALREVREEVGVEARIDRLVGLYSYAGRPVIIAVFAGAVVSGKPIAGHETREVGNFRPEEIPWAELAFPSTRDSLQDYLEAPRG